MTEKRNHFAEIRSEAERHADQREAIETAVREYDGFDRFARPDR